MAPKRKSNRPDQVGPYRVERELARGGMGVVLLARDTRLDRAVAIKVLPDEFATDDELRARFEREARILASLNHPNIAAIYELEQVDGAHYLILEFVTGETLKEMLVAGPLPLDRALAACSQIARAIEAAHERGVIHRDLKPANVKITPEGIVKVLDFGVAKTAPTDLSTAPTGRATKADVGLSSSELYGTPGYMSPEQIEGLPVDRRADIWAFGCLLYECLSGLPAFTGGTAFARFAATLELDPDFDALPARTPARVRRLLEHCLQKEAGQRLRNIADARVEIDQARTDLERANRRPAVDDATRRHNLTPPLTSFIGREREIAQVVELLGRSRHVTLTGIGGCGKTRLAIEVATRAIESFDDGAWFVDLAPLSDPALLSQKVAAALDIREEPGRQLDDTVCDWLADRSALLVLDACEHLLPVCATLAERVLRACPDVRILATSREAFGSDGEHTYTVAPLTIPSNKQNIDAAEVGQCEAARLLVQRALLGRPGFAITDDNAWAVAQVCRRLDGIPLAIELAAGWVRVLSVDELAARLDDRFRLLHSGKRGADTRHQTLRATIDWSYEHLSEREALLFRRLSVFVGGWSLEAAEVVCADATIDSIDVLELLTHLVDKSIVVVEKDEGRRRYRLLETVRQYAHERMAEAGDQAILRRRHLAHYLSLAEAAAPHLPGPEQAKWLDHLEREHENLRAGLDFAKSSRADVESGITLASRLWPYWERRAYWGEGRAHLTELLAAEVAGERKTIARANALDGAGFLACRQGDLEAARAACDESLAISRELADETCIASALEHLGYVSLEQGGYAEAQRLYEDSLARRRQLGDKNGIARSLNSLGLIADAQKEYELAHQLLGESLAVVRELGDRFGIAVGLNNLGLVAKRLGNYETARALCSESLAISRELGNRMTEAINLENLSEIAERDGDFAEARRQRFASLQIFRDLGDAPGVTRCLVGCAILEVSMQQAARAARLFGAAEGLREMFGLELVPADRAEHDPRVEQSRQALGDEVFAAEWGAGRGLSLQAAVEFALGADSR